jgi:hypothetical protein
MPTSNTRFSELIAFSSALCKHSKALRRYSFVAIGFLIQIMNHGRDLPIVALPLENLITTLT